VRGVPARIDMNPRWTSGLIPFAPGRAKVAAFSVMLALTFADLPFRPLNTLAGIVVLQVNKMDDDTPDCGWQEVYALYGCPLAYDD
jgi:hypothetical protein